MTIGRVSADGSLPYWPYCETCHQPFRFDPEEPFADCACGATEWGDPRPAAWVPEPAERAVGTGDGLRDALDRLRDSISGERRYWHKVEVRPDDIAAILGEPHPSTSAGAPVPSSERIAANLHVYLAPAPQEAPDGE